MRKFLGPILEIQEDKCLSWNVDIPPCQEKCPLGIDVEGYVGAIARGNFDLALEIIKKECPLPSVCAHICYAPCEASCKRGKMDQAISILDLKRAAVDLAAKKTTQKRAVKFKDNKIAIIGSGPAGLSCAYYLNQRGFPVTIFEASGFIGGMLRVGIPDFRLPKDVLDAEIERITQLGVDIQINTRINEQFSIDDIFAMGFKAIFIGTGAHESLTLGIPGEHSDGVLNGLDLLRGVNLGNKIEIGKTLAIIGGGNVAVDSARYARRLGSEVSILYRRSREEMPANDTEIRAAESEGINITCLVSPIEIKVLNRKAIGIRCIKNTLGAVDKTRRRQPIPISGSEFDIELETIISAIGEYSELSYLGKDSGIEINKNRTVKVNPTSLETTRRGVFAGGDIQAGPFTAISAMADGKQAAISIQKYLEGGLEKGKISERKSMANVLPRNLMVRKREPIHLLPSIISVRNFKEINLGFTPDQAIREARRCLQCRTCNKCLQGFDCVAIMPTRNGDKLSPRIDEDLCIGCSVCAQRCPYGNIQEKEMKSEQRA